MDEIRHRETAQKHKLKGTLSAIKQILLAFLMGVKTPTLATIVGTIFVALANFALCLLFLVPDNLKRFDPGYLMIDSSDDYAYISGYLFQESKDKAKDNRRHIYIFGSSAAREAIKSDEALENKIRELTGESVKVIQLSAGGLSALEMACISDAVPHIPNSLFVFQVSIEILSRPRTYLFKNPRLALADSSVFVEEAQFFGIDSYRSSNFFFIDNFKFFISRPHMLLNIVRGPRKRKSIRAGDWRIANEAILQWRLDHLRKWYVEYGGTSPSVYGIFQRVVRRHRSKSNSKIVFLESTRNPLVDEWLIDHKAIQDIHTQYLSDLDNFANENGISYVDIQADVAFSRTDFEDIVHIRSEDARVAYTNELAHQLAALFY